jgi:hypothetical protein
MSLDPESHQLPDFSPFNAMENNPVLHNDPDGDFIPLVVLLVAAAVLAPADMSDHGYKDDGAQLRRTASIVYAGRSIPGALKEGAKHYKDFKSPSTNTPQKTTSNDIKNKNASSQQSTTKAKSTSQSQTVDKKGPYKPSGENKNELKNDPKTGKPIVDEEAKGKPHTQLGQKTSSNKGTGEYATRRTIDSNGNTRKQIDFTDHGRPSNHTNPHVHNYNKNSNGQYTRQNAKPLK